jgi:deoxyadenosine/deoxycytidine kinase
MFIEFVGMMGAGKTTLAEVLKDLLGEMGLIPLTLNEAINKCLERTVFGNLINKWITSSLWRRRILRRTYVHIFYLYHKYAYMLSNPMFALSIYRSQLCRKLPWWHRRLIVRLFFDNIVGYLFLRNRLHVNEAVILDEGLMHRAVNLYAWEISEIDPSQIMSYFEHLPVLDLVIIIQAPLKKCMERLKDRGMPRRIEIKDQDTIRRYLDNAYRITGWATEFATDGNRKAIKIENDESIEVSTHILRHSMENILSLCGNRKPKY